MSRIGTRRSAILKRRSSETERLIALVQKAGLFVAIAAFLFWVGSWVTLSGGVSRFGEWTNSKTLNFTAGAGFVVANIMVEGRKNADVDTIRAIVNVEKGDPLFAFDPDGARDMLEKVSWVRAAHVERRLPDTIYIHLEERTPLALWQRDGKLAVIDADGVVLTDRIQQNFSSLPLVVGDGAPEHAAELVALLAAEPDVAHRVEAAIFVSGRRWDLKLKNGTIVKMPEDEMGFALSRLLKAQREEDLMDKELTAIDMRESDRITVRTRPGAVQEYKAGVKATAAGGAI